MRAGKQKDLDSGQGEKNYKLERKKKKIEQQELCVQKKVTSNQRGYKFLEEYE